MTLYSDLHNKTTKYNLEGVDIVNSDILVKLTL